MQENNETILKKYQKYWATVEDMLKEGTSSGHKSAILETEKILKIALNDRNLPGKNILEQIKSSEIILKNPEKLSYSRAMYNKIINESGFDISSEDTKEIISGYYQAIADIAKMEQKNINTKEKVNLFLQRYFYKFPEKTRKIFIFIFIFFLSVFVITETSTGQSISAMVVDITRFIFYDVLPRILMIIAVIIVIIGILYYWQNKKKKY